MEILLDDLRRVATRRSKKEEWSDIEAPSRTGISLEVTASETGGANFKYKGVFDYLRQ